MSPAPSCDAIVIGGGPNGLISAAYLARTGRSVMLLEAGNIAGMQSAAREDDARHSGAAHVLYALDPQVSNELKLARHGLRFAARDLALANLRSDAKPLVIRRDVHDTVAGLAVQSQHDAESWPRFRRELFEFGRAMRPFWRGDSSSLPGTPWAEKLHIIARTGAAAWLDSWFESDALKAALCFDATAGGVSVLEPGSALSLVWRAAQEMSGLQGAVALPVGGMAGLTQALVSAAQSFGCDLRQSAVVAGLLVDGERILGVELESGESILAPVVFSALSRPATFAMLPRAAAGIARTAMTARKKSVVSSALITLTLNGVPPLEKLAAPVDSRFVAADRLDTYVSAEMAARQGELAVELPMEVMIPTMMNTGLSAGEQHRISVLVRPVPAVAGDQASFVSTLSARVASTLERAMPGLSDSVLDIDVFMPDTVRASPRLQVEHMLAPAVERVSTPIRGLFLCGADAEPVPAISGCAARIATGLAGAGRR